MAALPAGFTLAGPAGVAAANHTGDRVYVEDGATGGDGSVASPYGSIQDAVDHADPGDTVFVKSGTYDESVVIDKSVHVVTNESVTMDGTGAGDVAFTVTNNASGGAGAAVEDVTISGFEMTNYHTGVVVHGDNVTGTTTQIDLQNVAIVNNTISGVERGIHYEAYSADTNNVTIAENTISDVSPSGADASEPGDGGKGISLYPQEHSRINGTTIAGNEINSSIDGPAIWIWADNYIPHLHNTTIVGNDGSTAEVGLELYLKDEPWIADLNVTANRFTDTREHAIEISTGGVVEATLNRTVIRNNALNGSGGEGLLVDTTPMDGETLHLSEILVEQNDLRNNQEGVKFDLSHSTTVEDVTFRENAINHSVGSGFQLRTSQQATVRNVTLDTNDLGDSGIDGIRLVSLDDSSISEITATGNNVSFAGDASAAVMTEDGEITDVELSENALNESLTGVLVSAHGNGAVTGLHVDTADARNNVNGMVIEGHDDARIADVSLRDALLSESGSVGAYLNTTGTATLEGVDFQTVGANESDGVGIMLESEDASRIADLRFEEVFVSDNDLGTVVAAYDDSTIETIEVEDTLHSRNTNAGMSIYAGTMGGSDTATVSDVNVTTSGFNDTANGFGLSLHALGATTIEDVSVSQTLYTGSYGGLGLGARDAATLRDVTVRQAIVNETDVGVQFLGGAGGTHERVVVEETLITDNDKGVEVRPDSPTDGLEVRMSLIADNVRGVVNNNSDAVLDVTNVWWGDSSGPSTDAGASTDPIEDPETGLLAAGDGDSVSEGSTAGVSNVRFDPAIGAKTLCADDGQLIDPVATDEEIEFSISGETISGPMSDFVGLCVWERSVLSFTPDTADAAERVRAPSVFLDADGGDVQIAGQGSNREYVGVYQAGDPVTMQFAKATGAETERFAGENAQLIVLRANSGAELSDAFTQDIDESTGRVTVGADAVSIEEVRNLGEIDGSGDLDDVDVTPAEPGEYLLLVATNRTGDGFAVTEDDELTFDALNTSSVVVGGTVMAVQETGSTANPRKSEVPPGATVEFDADSHLDADGVSHAVVVYDNETLEDKLVVIDSEGSFEDGTALVNVSGTLDGDPFYVRVNASEDGELNDIETSGDLAGVDAAATVLIDGASREIVEVPIGGNFSGGTYQWIHAAVATDDVTRRSTDVGTLTIDESAPARAPEISVSPGSYDFGTVTVGNSDFTLVEVENTGDAALEVDGASLGGSNPGQFRLPRGAGSTVLEPDENYTVKVRFKPSSSGSKSATLNIASNDSDEPTTTVALSGTAKRASTPSDPDPDPEPTTDVSVDRRGPNTATVVIRNARAGETVNATFTDGIGSDGVLLDGLEITLNETDAPSNFELDAEVRETTPSGTPDLAIVGETKRYVQIDERYITDDSIDGVRFRYRLSDAVLDGEPADDVSLYRYHDGEWVGLPTNAVGERNGETRFASESPGLSTFAVGDGDPRFEVTDASVTPTSVEVGELASVTATVENTGDAAGSFTAELTVDGDVIRERTMELDAGESQTVAFGLRFDEPGEYDLAMNGVDAGTLTVEEEETVTTTEPGTTEPGTTEPGTTEPGTTVPTTPGDDEGLPLVAVSIFVILLAALVATVLYFREEIQDAIDR